MLIITILNNIKANKDETMIMTILLAKDFSFKLDRFCCELFVLVLKSLYLVSVVKVFEVESRVDISGVVVSMFEVFDEYLRLVEAG